MTATYTQKRWSLADLFPSHDSPELKKAMKSLEKSVEAFEKNRSKLTSEVDEKTFLDMIKELEEITIQTRRMHGFSELWFTEDTQNQEAQALQAKIKQFIATQQNRVIFFSLWWNNKLTLY